jgi:hypothetical protein
MSADYYSVLRVWVWASSVAGVGQASMAVAGTPAPVVRVPISVSLPISEGGGSKRIIGRVAQWSRVLATSRGRATVSSGVRGGGGGNSSSSGSSNRSSRGSMGIGFGMGHFEGDSDWCPVKEPKILEQAHVHTRTHTHTERERERERETHTERETERETERPRDTDNTHTKRAHATGTDTQVNKFINLCVREMWLVHVCALEWHEFIFAHTLYLSLTT